MRAKDPEAYAAGQRHHLGTPAAASAELTEPAVGGDRGSPLSQEKQRRGGEPEHEQEGQEHTDGTGRIKREYPVNSGNFHMPELQLRLLGEVSSQLALPRSVVCLDA